MGCHYVCTGRVVKRECDSRDSWRIFLMGQATDGSITFRGCRGVLEKTARVQVEERNEYETAVTVSVSTWVLTVG